MDRREALKKLAAGGAIVAGGSLVLSSNAVAQTASGCGPAPANPFTAAQRERTIRLTDNNLVPGGTPGYNWRINRYANQARERRILVRRGNTRVVLGPTDDNYNPTVPSPFSGTFLGPEFTISRGEPNGSPDDLRGTSNATYSLSVLVTWTFTNGCAPLVQEYTIIGEARDIPSVTPVP